MTMVRKALMRNMILSVYSSTNNVLTSNIYDTHQFYLSLMWIKRFRLAPFMQENLDESETVFSLDRIFPHFKYVLITSARWDLTM